MTIVLVYFQRYDTTSSESYRIKYFVFLLCMRSELNAGSPFCDYLRRKNAQVELNHFLFWAACERYLTDMTEGNSADHLR